VVCQHHWYGGKVDGGDCIPIVAHQSYSIYVAFQLVLYWAYVELPWILTQPIFNIFNSERREV
jgi:hypothetical protein